jgi:hypothetical protein
MDFAFSMGLFGVLALMAGAVIFGVLVQLLGTPSFGYEWIATAIAAFLGGFAASEFVLGFRTFEPLYEGLALVPALIGGLVLGGVVAIGARLLASDTFTAHPVT